MAIPVKRNRRNFQSVGLEFPGSFIFAKLGVYGLLANILGTKCAEAVLLVGIFGLFVSEFMGTESTFAQEDNGGGNDL